MAGLSDGQALSLYPIDWSSNCRRHDRGYRFVFRHVLPGGTHSRRRLDICSTNHRQVGEGVRDARADGGDFISLDWTVDYEPVGSLAGLMRLNQPELDLRRPTFPYPSRTRQERPQAISDRNGQHCRGRQSQRLCPTAHCASRGRCLPTSSSERSSPGPTLQSKRSIRTTSPRPRHQRRPSARRFRVDPCLHPVPVVRQRRMENQLLAPTH